eukprot:m.211469 g.211469  ORF g.211469 m.211469 type:complete len:578 (+) comp15838_c0_seq18:205-1938(+)
MRVFGWKKSTIAIGVLVLIVLIILPSDNNQTTSLVKDSILTMRHNRPPKYTTEKNEIQTQTSLPDGYKTWRMHGILPDPPEILTPDKAPLGRNVSDHREAECKNAMYNLNSLPSASVVIVILPKEKPIPVLRTIHSVLARTPPAILAEILLLTDSDRDARHWCDDPEIAVKDNSGESLVMFFLAKGYIRSLPKTRVIRPPGKRKGLLGCRSYAVQQAMGESLTFIDSHVEVEDGWLEPMLDILRVNTHSISFPRLDWEDYDTWNIHKGGIGCTLGFLWSPLSEHTIPDRADARRQNQVTDPIASPALFGAVFSVHKKGFLELGGFDEEFGYGGSDNLELAFRTWMCGGRVMCAPCSRVFVVFYKHSGVGIAPGHFYGRNKLRVADLWMDEYAQIVKASVSKPPPDASGPLTERAALRNTLQCKSFQWYLDNVYKENEITDINQDIVGVGMFKNLGSNKCIDTMGKISFDQTIGLYGCHGHGSQQLILLRRGIIMPYNKMEICLKKDLKWGRCGNPNAPPRHEIAWIFHAEKKTITSKLTSECLSVRDSKLLMTSCSGSPEEMWELGKLVDFVDRMKS